MSTSQSSTCVYVRDDQHGWLPGNVLSVSDDGQIATVSVHLDPHSSPFSTNGKPKTEQRQITLADYESSALPLQNVDATGTLLTTADMCDLPSLHEPAIVYNLAARHQNRQPYTRVGEIIIAMNPFQWIDGLYDDEVREKYVDRLVWRDDGATSGVASGTTNAGIDDPKAGLDPHVYETSSLAYRGLAVDDRHQSILVTGESGAGKTETVKIIMGHLASIQSTSLPDWEEDATNKSTSAGGGSVEHHIDHHPRDSDVVRRVLDSNPLLEAFGNAKTIRNDNSSRFGKYIQLQFDVEDATEAAHRGKAVPSCMLAGSYCETYLLEKSRVVGHEVGERSYHIFYQLLAAPEDVRKEIWEEGLIDDSNFSFNYLSSETMGAENDIPATTIEGMTDGEKWMHTVEALATIGVTGDQMKTLMRSICVVLQLGNLEFGVDQSNEDSTIITNTKELRKLASLMGVDTELIERSITHRTMAVGGRGKESYSVPLRPSSAKDGCDAFAKEIYARSFDWLVRTINHATRAEENYKDAADVAEFGCIGLLDIFGFESFAVNRFEQLCINFANEKLQQKYTLDVFSSVQEEYEYEGIELGDIVFSDNSDVLQLIEGKVGIISILNEECIRPNGNDTAFVSKIKSVNQEAEALVTDRLHRPNEFAICHYAETVKYDATNFVTKNTDTLANDLLDCAAKSSNHLIATELLAAANAKAATSKSGRGRSGAVTVSANFRSQLSSLMSMISKTKTRYCRCIKPNAEKKPVEIDLLSATEQLRCAGVVSAVNISRAAFPNRLLHQTALDRFSCLLSERHFSGDSEEEKKEEEYDESLANSLTSLLDTILKGRETIGEDGSVTKAFVIGRTRVYFRAGALEGMENARLDALGTHAVHIERIARGFVARSKFLRTKDAAIVLQSIGRCHIGRSKFREKKAAAISISCWLRCINAKSELLLLRRDYACTLIQTHCRIYLAEKSLQKCLEAAVMIQKISRGSVQRPRYRTALKEAKEEAVVNKKIAALQKRLADAEMKLLKANGAVVTTPETSVETSNEIREKEPASVVETSSVDKKLLDESLEMIGILKTEVFELRSKNFLLRSDLEDIKHSNQHMSSQYASLCLTYDMMKQTNDELTKAKNEMLFKAAKEKKEYFNAKKKMNTENTRLVQEVSQLKKELQVKKSADSRQEDELARLRAENDRLKAKQSGTVVWKSDKAPPAMRRAAFNKERIKSANTNAQQSSASAASDEEWRLVTPRNSESREPNGSDSRPRRTRGKRGGRRERERHERIKAAQERRSDREPISPGSYTGSRGAPTSTPRRPQSKCVPRVASTTSLCSKMSSGRKKPALEIPTNIETFISASTVNTPTNRKLPTPKKQIKSSLARRSTCK